MLSYLARALLFFAAFTLEIKVHAGEALQLHQSLHVMQQPEGCLVGAVPCALRTSLGEKFKFDLEGAVVVLDQNSAVIRVSADEIRLVSGMVWVRSKKAFKVESEFGSGRVPSSGGELWVSRTDERMLVAATSGDAELWARGAKAPLIVEAGLENWIGRVTTQGEGSHGIPVAIALKPHLLRWARLFDGKRAEFAEAAQRFSESWSHASQNVAEIHKELYERKVASVEKSRERQLRQEQEEERHNRELRELFRQKLNQGVQSPQD